MVNQVFPYCSIVKLAEEECEICLGTLDPSEAASRLCSLGVDLACITLGDRGVLAQRGRDQLLAPAPKVEVVDTTGAGDGFVSGLMSRLLGAGPLRDLPRSELADHLRFACEVGSQVCTRRGAVAGLPRAAVST